MKIISRSEVLGTKREVHCPRGGFSSLRYLLASDGMGFSLHITEIPRGKPQHWHYKHHLEACYCVSGGGIITDLSSGEWWPIVPGTIYALDKHDDHTFEALEDTVLVSVFNPPVTGEEVHREDGSYAPSCGAGGAL
jgi:L-ectoine synthase